MNRDTNQNPLHHSNLHPGRSHKATHGFTFPMLPCSPINIFNLPDTYWRVVNLADVMSYITKELIETLRRHKRDVKVERG
jgi:hypothetical protein